MSPDENIPATPQQQDVSRPNAPVSDNSVPVPPSPEAEVTQPFEQASPSPVSLPVSDFHQLFDQIVEKIIEQQEAIIGPVAVEQAKKVHELKINWPQHLVGIDGNPQQAIDELVAQYKELFGQIAVQVSKEAVAAIMAKLPPEQQPKSLQ